MLAPDLVQPRNVASAVVISSSLSSVTFPDPSPGRRIKAASPSEAPAWKRATVATGARAACQGSVGWARPRRRGNDAGRAGGLEVRPMSTPEPGTPDPAVGASSDAAEGAVPRATPLRAVHESLGASMTPFAGWLMPLRYRSETAEHQAVRNAAGLFDLSHMGEIAVTGAGAAG